MAPPCPSKNPCEFYAISRISSARSEGKKNRECEWPQRTPTSAGGEQNIDEDLNKYFDGNLGHNQIPRLRISWCMTLCGTPWQAFLFLLPCNLYQGDRWWTPQTRCWRGNISRIVYIKGTRSSRSLRPRFSPSWGHPWSGWHPGQCWRWRPLSKFPPSHLSASSIPGRKRPLERSIHPGQNGSMIAQDHKKTSVSCSCPLNRSPLFKVEESRVRRLKILGGGSLSHVDRNNEKIGGKDKPLLFAKLDSRITPPPPPHY